ncbi:hypothetical protein ACKWTF_000438 [Chironomus riparius]
MSIFKKDNFDYMSDDLFGDDDDIELNLSNLENNTQESQDLSFSSQRFEDRRMLYESYMADLTIPTSQKNAMGFWKSLYKPTYSTQKIYELMQQRNLLGHYEAPRKMKTPKIRRKVVYNEDFGYDCTFFAPTKVLIEEQRRREDMPKAIKNIYEQKGIVNASQIYKIEQKLKCDSDESDVEMKPSTSGINKVPEDTVSKELNKSLRELSRTVSEQYEISQIMKDIQNISDLDASLTELSEKIQYSSKAEQLVNHTISCSQRLKILDDICTNNLYINTCDLLSDDELRKSSQESHCDIISDAFKSPAVPDKSDINDNIPKNLVQNNNESVPKHVKFSFASGKTINVDNESIMKFKTIFDNEEKKIQLNENLKVPEPIKNPELPKSASQIVSKNNGSAGFVFASGKSALISTSKLQAFEKKFKDEEAKLKKLESEFPSSSIELCSQKLKDNKENDGNAQNSPQKPSKKSSQENLKTQENELKSRTFKRVKGESSALRRIKSKSLLGLKPKKVKFDDIVIDKNDETDSTTNSIIVPKVPEIIQPVPMQFEFSFASGKNIKISDASVSTFKNIFENEERNMELLENAKEPQQVGFSFASGKNIKIDSKSVAKFKNIFETEERKIDSLESTKVAVPRPQNALIPASTCGFVFASGKTANYDSSKLLNIEKKFMAEEEKMKKIDGDLKVPECIKMSNNEIFIGSKNISTGNFKKFDAIKISTGSHLKASGSSTNSNVIPERVTGSKDVSTGNQDISAGTKIASNKSHEVTRSKTPTTGSINTSNENQDRVTGSRNNSTGSQRKLFENLSTGNQQKSGNEFNSIKNDKACKSNGSQIYFEDISLASQYRLSMEVYQSSSEDEKYKSKKSNDLNSRTKKFKSALTRNLKKPNFDINKNLNDSKIGAKIPSSSLTESNKNSHNENQPSTSKCAFVFASGKNVDINQSKIIDAKKNFAGEVDEHDISIPCQPSIDLSDKSQTSKAGTNDNDTQSSTKSSSKTGNYSINFNSHRLNSLRAKRKHEDDSDIFNFDLSTHSMRSKKTSQTPTAPANKILDSGIESQNNKVESPKIPFKKFEFFSPMFTSSPVVNPTAAKSRQKLLRLNDRKAEYMAADPFEAIKRKFMPDVNKPTIVKRLAVDNDDDIMISPIVKDKKRQKRSVEKPISSRNFNTSNFFRQETLGQRLADIEEFMDLQSQLNLIGNDPTESQVVSILEIEQQHISRYETENRVKIERKEAIKEQMEYVNNKPEDESRQMTGTMFMMKCGSRRNLKDYVENKKPQDKNIHELSFNNLLDLKFDMKNYIEDAWSRVSVTVADNAKLILDETSNVGFNEIMYSFLASYGVDPKLIKHEWLQNAYKMILMKFIWMENSFDKIEKFEVLTPENVLLQLKYRYDREIDRHQRPAIRKITERDEVSNRRIVLKVIEVIYNMNVGYELELSDGWYKMRTCVDSCLAEAISRKKIALNTKLLICNSELVNMFSSAYHPLELPQGVRLKIHGNSTRIVSYETKLGFCKIPHSFLISVDSISSDGGVIGRLKLFITHVYTIVYVESNGEKKEFRSEKMQNRLENKKEILYSTIFEKIQKQIMQESYNELKERVGKIDKSKLVLAKMSIHEICDILEYESETDLSYAIRSQMSLKQVEKIQEIYHQRKFELNQKIKERINQNENNVAQLLKFRVVDANKPKKTALVSWWQPSEELLNIIKQGNAIELFKTASAGKFQAMCGGEIQIHADKSTVVKLLKISNAKDKFDYYIRKETKFEDITHVFSPLNNEFDVACMIVHVNEKLSHEKLQRVYVANERFNFMSLNFYPSLTDYAYDDVLIEGKILYIRNLQWRKMFKHNNFPEAHAVIDSTIFISNPKDESQKTRLQEFMNNIEDTGNYLQKCREKLETFIGKIPSKSNASNMPLNFITPSPLVTSRKRVLGMKRIPQKYSFS